MKVLNILLLAVFITFPLLAAGAQEEDTVGISGTIDGGLRLLKVESSNGDLEYTIYRGDYIVFDFEDGRSHDFKVPELEIEENMPKAESDKPYVKMKKSGDYSFTLGNRNGVFHVLELVNVHYNEVTVTEANKLLKNVKPIIIDVRTRGEFEKGHIPGASLLPVQVFEENLATLEEYKNENILLYCASGNRSTVASKMLIDAGFTKVYNLRHGFREWKWSGLPVE
ncbi:MAG: rhodanese-like domain-containing protein [Spirochaetales bacterium]|nr:rhodanese-like domain-containing protein [Spirochaetales bacterium]